jgi:hypothetical protein
MRADSYKRWHRPNMSESARTKQGFYKVQHPEKYIGNPNLIIFRSSWEYSFSRWCDFSPSVVKWSSEPTTVQYADRISKLEECKKYGLNPNDPKNWVMRNYHVDFWLIIKKPDELLEKWVIEIKPSSKLKKPIPPHPDAPLKEHRKFNTEAKEYLLNESKWLAMNEYAKKNDAKFFIFTEQTLQKMGILGGKFDHPDIMDK